MNRTERIREACTFCEYALYFLNWLCLVSSALVLMIGLYMYSKFDVVQVMITENFKPDLYIITLSVLLFIIGFVGHISILQKNLCLLCMYMLIALVLLFLYVPIGCTSLIMSVDNYKSDIGISRMWMSLNSYYELEESRVTIDKMQETLHCCGITNKGYKDWGRNRRLECNDYKFATEKCPVPTSCCQMHEDGNTDNTCGVSAMNTTVMPKFDIEELVYRSGCLSIVDVLMKKGTYILGILSVCTTILVLVSLVFAIVLLKVVDESQEVARAHQNYMMNIKSRPPLDPDSFIGGDPKSAILSAKLPVKDLKFPA